MFEHLERVDALIAKGGRYAPRWGWHDNHKLADRTPEYLPALMQVRAEYAAFIYALETAKLIGGRCLQLGLGESTASHDAWCLMFKSVTTLDLGGCARDAERFPGLNTHEVAALDFAACEQPPYDMLFIDAGHSYEDVQVDYMMYAPLVRKGGIIAFHDALERVGFEEIGVARFLLTLEGVQMIGDEVGIAWQLAP